MERERSDFLEIAPSDPADCADPLLDLRELDLLLPVDCTLERLEPDLAGDLLRDLGDLGLGDLFLAEDRLTDLVGLALVALERASCSSSERSLFAGVCAGICEDAGLPLRLDAEEAEPLSESDP